MGKCFGCAWCNVGCPYQRFWSDRVSRPCAVHTEKELEEKERERRGFASS